MPDAPLFRCGTCGAELRYPGRAGGTVPRCPYDGLPYAALRAGHDAIYFGPWRKIDASPFEVRRAYRRIGRHLEAIRKVLSGEKLPAAAGDLSLGCDAYHAADLDGASGDSLRFMDNALSYAHRAIDDLLISGGYPSHHPMDFAEWYDAVEVPFREEE
ncbi:MAG: hypothetical protein HZB86_00550 [Deltaproteobacteria bacterium]|nr:hypothetical protein [Deltaproteobacteria bacterium]